MSYLALYRKYRPSSFSDLVGQSEVSSIIKNEIVNDKISHAYLFSGPRGTGKTSTAKIIAKMINCNDLRDDGLPCGKCLSCLNFDSSSDVVEIDAASNNGVDEIRDLRDKVNLVPTFGKYKIYIIDEVHMLTTQAFNALLKTLEEPPAHVVFILATTEFYKIPTTVVSRCQKFQFLKFSNDDIINRLADIASKESISIDRDVLNEIARLSDGGMRDAINMLDQLSSFKDHDLTVQDVYQLNGVVSYCEFFDLLNYISHNEVLEIVNFVERLDQNGKSLDRFLSDFISFLKDVLIFKNAGYIGVFGSEKGEYLQKTSNLFNGDEIYSMIISFNDLSIKLKNSSFSKIFLIIEFVKLSKIDNNLTNNDNKVLSYENNTKNEFLRNTNFFNKNNDKLIGNNKKLINIIEKDKKNRIHNAFATASKDLKIDFMKKWNLVLEKLNNDSNYISIVGIMSDVEVMVVGNYYVIFVAQYDSLLERLGNCIDQIEQLLYDVYQNKYKTVFLARDEWNYEKDKYISALKSGEKYEYIKDDEDCMINQLNSVDEIDSDVEKIVSILGNEIISYE